jgi:hypothetical protein
MPAQIPEPAVWQALSPFHPRIGAQPPPGRSWPRYARCGPVASRHGPARRMQPPCHWQMENHPRAIYCAEAFPRKSWLSWRGRFRHGA